MERYIGIVFGEDGTAAAVVLSKRKHTYQVDRALSYNSGRFLAIDELVKNLDIEGTERTAVGCYFDSIAVVELPIPHDLMPEEVVGMVQFQMSWQVPIPESEMTYHYRRLERDPNIVRVVGMRSIQWQHQMDFLLSTRLQADIITSPLIAGDVGLTEGNWSMPAFDPEFSFGTDSVLTEDKSNAKWSDSAQEWVKQCENRKEGGGSTDLVKIALQMALLAASNDPLLLMSTSITMPEELKPQRNIFLKRVIFLLGLVVLTLALGFLVRIIITSMTNADSIEATRKVLRAQVEAIEKENVKLNEACTRGEEILKTLGNARLYPILANIYRYLPKGSYIESVRCANDGAVVLTIYEIGNVSKFRNAIYQIEGVIITAMPSAKNDKGVYHTVTIKTKEDEKKKELINE